MTHFLNPNSEQTVHRFAIGWLTYLFEVSRHLNLADGLHEGVPDDDADVRPGVAVRLGAQGDKVSVRQAGGGRAQVQLEHEGAGMLLRQRDVNTLLKSGTTPQYWLHHMGLFTDVTSCSRQ